MLPFFPPKKLFLLLPVVWLCFVPALTAFQITGATGGVNSTTGARPLRYEIHDFANSGAPFDLLILSLIELQTADQADLLSYFQISGIHGFPRIPWDGVVGNGSYPGFCCHAAVPFPLWHRPYMALFEQVLWTYAQDIASAYPDDQVDEYQDAALTLRHPYWDWALYPALPDVVTQTQLSINTPQGLQTVDNPLFAYNFQSDAAGNGFPAADPMANFSTTVRWWEEQTQSSNQSAATAALMANAPTILSLTYQLLTAVSNYTTFSCTWPGGQTGIANNIEGIHNSIHNSVGGFGHMAFPETAGFDPVFWLHHAMVDRLVAMWQVLYPDSFIAPTVNEYGTYYEPVGTIDSETSVLAPFHSDAGGSNMFTPDSVRSIKTFGYSYPELIDWEFNASELAANVRSEVNTQYNPSATTSTSRMKKDIKQRSASVADSFGDVTIEMARSLGVNSLDRQWSITVLVDRYPLNTSFSIDFFMGDAPSDVSSWATAKNLIGTYAQFGPANVSILRSKGRSTSQVRSEISMTHTLAAGMARGVLADLSPESVAPLLRDSLNWKVRTAFGQEVPVTSLAGLSISVYSKSAVPNEAHDQFPRYGPVQWEPSVTKGKPGGASR